MSPPKNYEKYPNHPNHPSNQYNPITHNNEQSRLGSYTTEPKPRTRGYNQRNSSSEPPLRNESYLIGVGDPYSKHINNIPTYMPKKDNAPFATDADQLSQLLMKNERQSPAPVRKISDDFLRHDTENNINESPNYFASQLNKSPKKITEAITESKKHNIFPHDAFMMLKRRMFNIRGDLNTLDDSPFPREKIFLVSHLQGRADQLEALGNKKTVQESLERRILVSVNTVIKFFNNK